VLSNERLSDGQNGIPVNFTISNDEFGIASAAIGDWDGNGYGDFASTVSGSYALHVFLMGVDSAVDEIITVTPASNGYGYTAPVTGEYWGHSLAFVGEEPLPGSPSETGVRLLLSQLGAGSIYDFLVTRNGTFAESRRYTQQSPGI